MQIKKNKNKSQTVKVTRFCENLRARAGQSEAEFVELVQTRLLTREKNLSMMERVGKSEGKVSGAARLKWERGGEKKEEKMLQMILCQKNQK